MRLLRCLSLAILFSITTLGQVTTTDSTKAASSTAAGDAPPSSGRSYQDYGSTRTVDNSATSTYGSMRASSSVIGAANETLSTSSESGSSTSVTLLVGGHSTTSTVNGTLSSNATASRTSSTVQPTNTTPCNGHPHFCARKFSNITYVAAHNSPFSRPDNAASNQALDVRYQLDDGIRMRKLLTTQQEILLLTCQQYNSRPIGTNHNKKSTSATPPATSSTLAL
jgi:hypothetical protein